MADNPMTPSTTNYPIRVGNSGFLSLLDSRFLVEIRAVEGNQIWTSFPGINYPVSGAGGHLEFHHENGFVAYNVQVLRYADRPEAGIILERSESADARTHRTSWRVPTHIDVICTPRTPMTRFEAVMEDLSADGCQLRAVPVLPVRAPVEMAFALDREHGKLIIEGRVCYVQEESAMQSPPALRYGVRFLHVPPLARRLLTLYLYHEVRRLYPRDVAAMYPQTRQRQPK